MTRCSTSLVIRETQIKSTLRYHFIPTKITIMKKKKDGHQQVLARMWKNGILMRCLWKCKMVQLL